MVVVKEVSLFVDGGGAGVQSLPGVKNRRQEFVFHRDQRKRSLGDLLGFSGDKGHRIPHKTHLIPANHGLIRDGDPKTVSPRHIFSRQYGHNSGQFCCFLNLNGFYQSVRVWTSQYFPM